MSQHVAENHVFGVGEIVASSDIDLGAKGLCTICGSPVIDIEAHIRFHRNMGHIVEDKT